MVNLLSPYAAGGALSSVWSLSSSYGAGTNPRATGAFGSGAVAPTPATILAGALARQSAQRGAAVLPAASSPFAGSRAQAARFQGMAEGVASKLEAL